MRDDDSRAPRSSCVVVCEIAFERRITLLIDASSRAQMGSAVNTAHLQRITTNS